MFTLHNIYFITKINDTVVDSNPGKELIVLCKPNMKMTQMKVTIYLCFLYLLGDIFEIFRIAIQSDGHMFDCHQEH